jgi:hypothetical protein
MANLLLQSSSPPAGRRSGRPGGPTASRCLSCVEGDTAEEVEGFSHAGDSWAVLGEQLPAGSRQPTSRAGQHADRARPLSAPDRLTRGAGSQISKPVVVEVAGRQRKAKPVASLHHAADLGEQPSPGGRQPTGRAVQHADRARRLGTADGLKRSADSKVGEPVVVEVSRRQRPAERIKGL